MSDYKLVAPDMDALINVFERGFTNSSVPSKELCEAMDPLFKTLGDLAPLKKNDEAKAIWITVPRGAIEDFGSYEDMLEWGEFENREEFEQYWLGMYPEPVKWYEIVLIEAFPRNRSEWFRAVSVENRFIINAQMEPKEDGEGREWYGREDAAIALCPLLIQAAEESMRKLRDGTYNDFVRSDLPYRFRTGVVPRSVVWERDPEWKEYDLGGLDEEAIHAFRSLIICGANNDEKTKKLQRMTANDFFRACAIGYKACGYEGAELPLVEQYFLHADGRDEGLSGRGHGLNAGPGIDFDDADAWDEWFFHREQQGGHPWEVCRGGNSTHLDLYVCHDQRHLDYLLRAERITDSEHKKQSAKAGYYFEVAGKYRATEAVRFYVALHEAGLPVILRDANEILARYDGSGYIGIVPRDYPTRYCENLFPEKYGRIIDFIHVYQEEMEKFGDAIEWLPEEEAKLIH